MQAAVWNKSLDMCVKECTMPEISRQGKTGIRQMAGASAGRIDKGIIFKRH